MCNGQKGDCLMDCNVWNEIFKSQLPGVIIGGVITGAFTLLVETIKYVYNRKEKFITERTQTYLHILQTYYEIAQEEDNDTSELFKSSPALLAQYYPAINIYASSKIKTLFDKTIKGNAEEKELIKQMRKELGIKD